MSTFWFGARSFYLTTIHGKPRSAAPESEVIADDLSIRFTVLDAQQFDPRLTSLEERVVVLRARSLAVALAKAEKEAEGYASVAVNQLGQKLRCRRVGPIDVYQMSEAPDAGVEVFSRVTIRTKDEAGAVLKTVGQSRNGFGFFEPDLWLTSQSAEAKKRR